MSAQPLGPFKLVTVNTAPERAKRLIGRVVEDVKDKYTIIHSGNADSEYTCCQPACMCFQADLSDQEQVRAVVEEHKPDLLVRRRAPRTQRIY